MPGRSVLFLVVLSVPLAPGEGDWAGWRGPGGHGRSSGSPPVEWSETKNVRWKAALEGAGHSSPIVFGDRVFVTTAAGTGKKRAGEPSQFFREPYELEEQDFLVLALAREDGREVWRRRVLRAMPHEPTHRTNTYATPTPVTDGERVYCSFGSFGLYALTRAGELLWQKDLGDLTNNGHGEGSSPLLHDGSLFVLWGHSGASFLVRLDAASGEERWRAPLPQGTNCTTPVLLRFADQEQVVAGGRCTLAFDPATGKELWAFGEREADGITAMATPATLDELLVVPGVNRRALRALIAPNGSGAAEELWQRSSSDNIPSPLIHDTHVYFLKGDSGQLTVLELATGEPVYGPERLSVVDAWASPLVAGGRLYVLGRDGTAEVLALAPEVQSLAVNVLDDQFEATPAVAGNELFLRGHKSLYCLVEPSTR